MPDVAAGLVEGCLDTRDGLWKRCHHILGRIIDITVSWPELHAALRTRHFLDVDNLGMHTLLAVVLNDRQRAVLFNFNVQKLLNFNGFCCIQN
jgi:hypothetical protein